MSTHATQLSPRIESPAGFGVEGSPNIEPRGAVRGSGAAHTPVPTWFDTIERRSLLMQVARLWIGTPFFANSSAPGPQGGVDCVNLANAIYATCACIPRQTIPRQLMDWGQHSDRSVLIDTFETWPDLRDRFTRLPDCNPDAIQPGDALIFRAGRVPHHCGVMLTGGDVIHAIAPTGVHTTQLRAVIRGQRILGLLEAVFRPHP